MTARDWFYETTPQSPCGACGVPTRVVLTLIRAEVRRFHCCGDSACVEKLKLATESAIS